MLVELPGRLVFIDGKVTEQRDHGRDAALQDVVIRDIGRRGPKAVVRDKPGRVFDALCGTPHGRAVIAHVQNQGSGLRVPI